MQLDKSVQQLRRRNDTPILKVVNRPERRDEHEKDLHQLLGRAGIRDLLQEQQNIISQRQGKQS